MTPEAAADAYISFYESLTPDSLARLDDLCAPNVRFRDPFNDVVGPAACRAVLEKMFADVTEPRFRVIDRAHSGQVCYLRWRFTFITRTAHAIDGMSEVHFDTNGKVTAHFDHWDSARVYEMVPVLGAIIRLVKRRLAVRQD